VVGDAVTSAEVVTGALKGRTLRYARQAAAKANCRLGWVKRRFSSRGRYGRIIGQQPRAGSLLCAGTPITAVLSRGRRR
jgi:beta-lactam-binding protein with PASTA domain